jgi:hypothetical protein
LRRRSHRGCREILKRRVRGMCGSGGPTRRSQGVRQQSR